MDDPLQSTDVTGDAEKGTQVRVFVAGAVPLAPASFLSWSIELTSRRRSHRRRASVRAPQDLDDVFFAVTGRPTAEDATP